MSRFTVVSSGPNDLLHAMCKIVLVQQVANSHSLECWTSRGKPHWIWVFQFFTALQAKSIYKMQKTICMLQLHTLVCSFFSSNIMKPYVHKISDHDK